MTVAALLPRPEHAPPPTRAELAMDRLYVTGALVDAGGRHLSRRQGGQDHAIALRYHDALVLAACDGVSRFDRHASRAEVGAGLVAELAARSAADAALRGLGSCDVRQHVAGALVRHLLPLWVALGPGAGSLLHCTLVLAVATPEWTTIWRVGDGAWGATGSLAHGFRPPTCVAPVACYGRRWAAHGREYTTEGPLPTTVARLCRGGDVDAVAAGLQPVLEAEGPALSLYVATDGLQDEPGADAVLRSPHWNRGQLEEALARPDDCDDFAAAWAGEMLPGIVLAQSQTSPNRSAAGGDA